MKSGHSSSTTISPLQRTLKAQYENSNKPIKAPHNLLHDLQFKSLYLADHELTEEDIPILCQFLSLTIVTKRIERLIITVRSYSGVASRKCAVNSTNAYSALNFEKGRLWKAVIKFIEKSEKVQFLIVDSVRIPSDLLESLGNALSQTKSNIQWLGFKNCPIGNAGLRVLSPHLGKMHMQVLALENCGLKDDAMFYIASIIKAQESHMDNLFWKATLRTNDGAHSTDLVSQIAEVLPQGMLALSLRGNEFSVAVVSALIKVLKKNYWLAAIDLSNCKLSRLFVEKLSNGIESNRSLEVVLLSGNPAFGNHTNDLFNFLKERRANSRMQIFPISVSNILKKWVNQSESNECDVEDIPRPAPPSSPSPSSLPLERGGSGVVTSDVLENAIPSPSSDNNLKDVIGSPNRFRHASPIRGINMTHGDDGYGHAGDDGRPPSRMSTRPIRLLSAHNIPSERVQSNSNDDLEMHRNQRHNKSPKTKTKRTKRPSSAPNKKTTTDLTDSKHLHVKKSILELRSLMADISPNKQRIAKRVLANKRAEITGRHDYDKMQEVVDSVRILIENLQHDGIGIDSSHQLRKSSPTRMKHRVRHTSSQNDTFDRNVVTANHVESDLKSVSSRFLDEFTRVVLSATQNLVEVSCKLKAVAENLSESVLLQQSMNQSRQEQSFNNSSNNIINNSNNKISYDHNDDEHNLSVSKNVLDDLDTLRSSRRYDNVHVKSDGKSHTSPSKPAYAADNSLLTSSVIDSEDESVASDSEKDISMEVLEAEIQDRLRVKLRNYILSKLEE